MKRIKDKKIFVLIGILIVFSIAYFVVVNKVSYAFDNNFDLSDAYNNRIKTITSCAVAYGRENIEEFNEDGLLYITVQTLIDKNYLIPNSEGNINNYLNNLETLNDKKIRLKNENNKISAEIYS